MKRKQFLTYFLIAFVLFIIVGLPARGLIHKVSTARPFQTESEAGGQVVDLSALMDHSLVDPKSDFFHAFQDKKRVNFLLLGINTGLTDTIMLASFDMESQHIDLISIPRDTYYPRKGFNTDAEKKINAAYRGNVVNTANAVSDVLEGIPIHYYAIIDYKGVGNIVDTLGGVPMNIPFDMDYDDPRDKPPLHIHFKKGPTVLKGDDAIKFLRYRKDKKKGYGYVQGDIGRVAAQQEFMESAFRQALGLKLPAVAKSVFENVTSNVDVGTLLKIASQAVGMSPDSVKAYTLPGKGQDGPPWYWYPDQDKIKEMLTEIYSVEPHQADTASAGALSKDSTKEQ